MGDGQTLSAADKPRNIGSREDETRTAHWHSARWAWNGYQPGLGSIPRPGNINCFRITGAHALRLISRTGKMVWRCPL